jgi:predicted glutamine amidotransferase
MTLCGARCPLRPQYNCHPFTCGRYLFMHNGNVHGFTKIRRALLERLRDCLFEWLSGTTDSELLFALFLNQARLRLHTQ